jgi:hypothetical protein
MWVPVEKIHRKGSGPTIFSIHSLSLCMWVSMEIGTYMQVYLWKGKYTSKSVPYLGHTIEQNLSGLSVVVFLSMGHYPCYMSPDFIIIKSSQYWFSIWVFF